MKGSDGPIGPTPVRERVKSVDVAIRWFTAISAIPITSYYNRIISKTTNAFLKGGEEGWLHLIRAINTANRKSFTFNFQVDGQEIVLRIPSLFQYCTRK
jgi:hypothetical protein